jgi:hypothetical protein
MDDVRQDVESYSLSPSQGIQLLALADLLKRGEIAFRADEERDEQHAAALIADVAQEIALQVGA